MSSELLSLREGERLVDLQRAGFRIIQRHGAYHFGLDAVLLAHFAAPSAGKNVCDLACGDGILSLLIKARIPDASLTGMDADPSAIDRALRSAALNGVAETVRFMQADLNGAPAGVHANTFDLAVCNPPYYPADAGTLRHGEARTEQRISADQLVLRARALLKNRGSLCMVYPAGRLDHLFALLTAAGLPVKNLRLVHPQAGRPATLCLVRAQKGVRPGGLRVSPPLLLAEADGQPTAEIHQIYNT